MGDCVGASGVDHCGYQMFNLFLYCWDCSPWCGFIPSWEFLWFMRSVALWHWEGDAVCIWDCCAWRWGRRGSHRMGCLGGVNGHLIPVQDQVCFSHGLPEPELGKACSWYLLQPADCCKPDGLAPSWEQSSWSKRCLCCVCCWIYLVALRWDQACCSELVQTVRSSVCPEELPMQTQADAFE